MTDESFKMWFEFARLMEKIKKSEKRRCNQYVREIKQKNVVVVRLCLLLIIKNFIKTKLYTL